MARAKREYRSGWWYRVFAAPCQTEGLPVWQVWKAEVDIMNFKDHMAIKLRIRELTKAGIRHEDIPELRRLVPQLYSKDVIRDLIEPLFNALQKKPRVQP